ncbi:MAG: MGMT family protein [Clostridiales bacterium]|jgi:methylated-DNA-protein-cysteine methyltransferase-like protein|nr:MGMT family protein [Clostridiales bacterium]
MGFFEDVYRVVKEIPSGTVMSYGTVAAKSGNPRAARQVGWALHVNPDPDNIPCHRVVTKAGGCSRAFAFGGESAQRNMLLSEGVEFIGDNVNMKKHSCL